MVSRREPLPHIGLVRGSMPLLQYGAPLGFCNLVRNAGKVISVVSATLIITTTMGALGFSPSLDAPKGQTDGVGDVSTKGIGCAFVIMAGHSIGNIISGRKTWSDR